MQKTTQKNSPDIVIITGLSGSGMTSATNAFEDLGYFCVDNMPLTLLPTFARLVQARDHERGSIDRAALVISFREGRFLADFAKHLEKQGIKYSDGPHMKENGSGFAFIDAPEGYEIELMQLAESTSKI